MVVADQQLQVAAGAERLLELVRQQQLVQRGADARVADRSIDWATIDSTSV